MQGRCAAALDALDEIQVGEHLLLDVGGHVGVEGEALGVHGLHPRAVERIRLDGFLGGEVVEVRAGLLGARGRRLSRRRPDLAGRGEIELRRLRRRTVGAVEELPGVSQPLLGGRRGGEHA